MLVYSMSHLSTIVVTIVTEASITVAANILRGGSEHPKPGTGCALSPGLRPPSVVEY